MKLRLWLVVIISLIWWQVPIAQSALAQTSVLPTLGDTERADLSPLMERKLGEEIMHDIQRDPDYLNDAPVLEYLNQFGNVLLAARPEARGEAGFDFFFFAVRDPTLNAFALPGGNIGVHSALVLAAQNESELAGVLAHEIGHVAQRHIARMLGKQRQDALIPLAAMVLAALAGYASHSSDAPMAVMMGGQGLAIQRQIDFTRDAEREADRVGLQIMRDAGFDTSGMISFFTRIQNASRIQNDVVPPFLRSHPMTTERIADIQSRTRDIRYKQRVDSLDFYLVRSRLRVLQDDSTQGLRDAAEVFNAQLRQKNHVQTAAAKYGLAFIALKQGDYPKAQSLLKEAVKSAQDGHASASFKDPIFTATAIDIKLAAGDFVAAANEADVARNAFPLSRGIARQYADALYGEKRYDDAVRYLRDQVQLYASEPELRDQLAKTYAAQKMQALEHMALADAYALRGSRQAALDQLNIARHAPDATFYDQAMIDARERDLKKQVSDDMKDKGKRR